MKLRLAKVNIETASSVVNLAGGELLERENNPNPHIYPQLQSARGDSLVGLSPYNLVCGGSL